MTDDEYKKERRRSAQIFFGGLGLVILVYVILMVIYT